MRLRSKRLLAAFGLAAGLYCCIVAPISYAQRVITTVAGNGRFFRGSGGSATIAVLGEVAGVTVDSAGNVFATDATNNIVVKITPNGILTVVAGNNIKSFSGDGGPATDASLNLGLYNFALNLVADGSGNLYFADGANQRIRKLNSDGTISTVAGNGRKGFSGDGGPATNASLADPTGLALDAAGNLYFSESSNNRVRKMNPAGIISTVAGSNCAGFSGDGGPATSACLSRPTAVALDASGNIYIADSNNHRVRKVSVSGFITTVAGDGRHIYAGDGGLAINSSVLFPKGVAVDSGGNLYIAGGGGVRKVIPSGIITNVYGGPAVSVVASAGNLYVADNTDGQVRQIGSGGVLTAIAGTALTNFSGDGVQATFSSLSSPNYVTLDTSGNLYIADSFNNRIRKVAPNGIMTTVAGNGAAGFSGDGGLAVNATLNLGPYGYGVTVDASGNLYFADAQNNRIRKVNPTGIINTIAGNGQYTFSGDGGPATNASLANPSGMTVDSGGNLYIADNSNNRIRKVAPNGIITTVAGNGCIGPVSGCFSGDGGPAVNASLSSPTDVAIDAGGNLYIADPGNARIRVVSPNGIISTISGGGNVSGIDGIPATTAGLNWGSNIALDAAGNLYIAENLGSRVRKVGADGIITTVAGTGTPGFSGDGGVGPSAALNFPSGVAVDRNGNLFIADTGNDRVREVLAIPPTFSVAPATLKFTVRAGTGVVAAQQINVASPATGLAWSAQASTQSGGGWLTVSPVFGSAPGVINVSVAASDLVPGNYQGTVTIVAPFSSSPAQTATIALTVNEAPAPKLVAEPVALTFDAQAGAASTAPKTLRITNAGGGTVQWTAQATTNAGGNWLQISPASGSVTSTTPISAQVSAVVGNLAAGVYSGSIVLTSPTSNEKVTVPVTALISQVKQTIVLSQSGLQYTTVEGSSVGDSQTVGILNGGEGVMNWNAQATVLSGGTWLTVTPASGSSDAASLRVPQITAAVNSSGMKAGQYDGLIRINATGAANSPQFVTVKLNVLPAGSNPGVLVRPSGLIFSAQAGTSSPGSQRVKLSLLVPGNVEVVSGVLTRDGGDWIERLPRNLVLSSDDPTRAITVQPSLGSLAPNVYRGAMALQFSDGTPTQVVDILFVVVPGPGGAALARAGGADDYSPLAGACVPKSLQVVQRTLGTNFVSKAGAPTTLGAQVIDDCGNAVTDASVTVRFSNSDAPVTLVSLRDGTYEGTWNPSNEAPQVTATARIEHSGFTPVELQSVGAVGGNNASGPQVSTGGIVNAASFAAGDALAPGSIVSVFGRNLGSAAAGASVVPLPTSLAGVSLNVSGADVPLFYGSGGQINAQLPFTLAPNSRPSVVVRTHSDLTGKDTVSVPQTITIADARPAIFSINSQGTGQGAILDAKGNLANSAAAVAAGEVVQIFATGLGVTTPLVASGQPAPNAEPLARVVVSVQATVGGIPATVQFAGLAPGFVGLYQVNVQIPIGVAPGTDVPLVLLQNGVPSNTVTLSIR